MSYQNNYNKIYSMRNTGYSVLQISRELKLSSIYVAKVLDDLAAQGYCKPLELDIGPSYVLDGSTASYKVTGEDRWFDGCLGG